MKRAILPAAVAAVLFVGAAWWFALSQTGPTAERPLDIAAPAAAPAAPAPVQAPVAPHPSAAVPAAIARLGKPDLRNEIRDRADLRAYYEGVRGTPDPSGERSYLLAQAISECLTFVDVPYADLSNRLAVNKEVLENSRRQEVFTFMYERCKGFSGNAAAMGGIIQSLLRHAEFAGYPAAIARSLREPGRRDPERADDIAKSLLAAPVLDPDVVHEIAEYLARRYQRLPGFRADAQARSIAWGLLECDLGADCGPKSRPVVMTCIAFGACDLQRVEDAIAAQGSQAEFGKASAMRQQLARHIAAHDWYAMGFVSQSFDPPGATK